MNDTHTTPATVTVYDMTCPTAVAQVPADVRAALKAAGPMGGDYLADDYGSGRVIRLADGREVWMRALYASVGYSCSIIVCEGGSAADWKRANSEDREDRFPGLSKEARQEAKRWTYKHVGWA